MRHRIYSRIRHIPTGAWTDILFTGRTKEDGVIPVHPQNVIDSHLEAAAKVFSLPLGEFEVVEFLDADPAGHLHYGETGEQELLVGGQSVTMKQPTPAPPLPTRREILRAKATLGTLTPTEILEALKEVL